MKQTEAETKRINRWVIDHAYHLIIGTFIVSLIIGLAMNA